MGNGFRILPVGLTRTDGMILHGYGEQLDEHGGK